MAQLHRIKIVNTIWKTEGDIIGVHEDTKRYSMADLEFADVLSIKGGPEDIIKVLNSVAYDKDIAYQVIPSIWLLARDNPIERKEVWKDRNGKWYWLKRRPKYIWSTSKLTPNDIDILQTRESGLARDLVLKRMVVNPGEWDTINTTEAKDLNG